MKAVQFKDVDQLVLAELEVPQIGDDEILVSLRSVGICHSDFELLEPAATSSRSSTPSFRDTSGPAR